MGEFLNILALTFVLVVLVWVTIFGGVGALLARSRGMSQAVGFAWGGLLGPIGWLVIVFLTRGAGRRERRGSAGAATIVNPGISDGYDIFAAAVDKSQNGDDR